MAGEYRGYRVLMLSRVIRFVLVVVVSVLTIASLGCGSAPDAPEYDNPIIPDDPNFEPPQTTIITGPTQDAVLDTHAVTFTWAGNQDSMTFAYRLNEASWSDWAADTTATFQYLDEGDYLFEVQGQYASRVIEDTAATHSFTVDDIHGPALWLYPRYQEVNYGSPFSVEVMLEEVENVFAVKAVLEFNPAAVQVSQIEIYEDSRSLLKANGGTVIPFSEYDNALGTAIIEVATTTGSPPGISGSGAIAIIRFSSISRGQSIISFEATRFRDPENNPIAITEAVQTIIDVR